jgi:methylamine dehydrogenase light chain
MQTLDRWTAALSRRLARGTSRRGFLAGIGGLLAGGGALPLLPVSRAGAQTRTAAPGEPALESPEGDPDGCSYWRYCALDGFLASCCGGTHTSCPPGTEMSPLTWLGTCKNPVDGKHYVISYNDCCGKDICGKCFCRGTEREKPIYITHKNNDVDWCMGTRSVIYNSTVAVVVGVATVEG